MTNESQKLTFSTSSAALCEILQQKNMKMWIVALVAALLFWDSATLGSSRLCFNDQLRRNKLHSSDLTFYIDDPTPATYSKFLKNLREKVTCYDLEKHDLRVLCTESDVQGSLYFMVDLSYNSVPVTLALDVVNLDLVAYKAGQKSYFFANTDDLKTELFTETEQSIMPFTNSYKSLGSRAAAYLGMSALRQAHDVLRRYDSSAIKSSLINVIGMVSEAARLKLIENAVNNNFEENIRPNSKMISYQDNWRELSKEIQRSKNGEFSHAIELKNENDIAIRVTSVGQVQANMGILKYYAPMEKYAVA